MHPGAGMHRPAIRSHPLPSSETTLKALLIEDTLTSATLVSHQLRKMGITPLLARDGETGIELFQKEHPDLVLLDIIMPGLDGFEVARRIRQLEKEGEWTPIIFLTARTGDEFGNSPRSTRATARTTVSDANTGTASLGNMPLAAP